MWAGWCAIYTAIAALSGAWCYFALLSSHLLPICYRLATIFTKAMGVILLPLTTIRRLGKNFSEICKNLFPFPKGMVYNKEKVPENGLPS